MKNFLAFRFNNKKLYIFFPFVTFFYKLKSVCVNEYPNRQKETKMKTKKKKNKLVW